MSNKVEMPDLFSEVPENKAFLKDVRFALIGKFSQAKSVLSKQIEKMGGDKKITLAKESCVVVIGANPTKADWDKLDTLKHDGFHIPQITELEFMDILEGRNKSFHFPKVIKNVNIDYDFIVNPKYKCLVPISKDGITHRIGGREIFVFSDACNIQLLWQTIGNLAGEARNVFSPYETDYILLWESTLNHLKDGNKDELIRIIEKGYNESKAEKFNYKFILAKDFIDFAKERSIKVDDKITLDLISRYGR